MPGPLPVDVDGGGGKGPGHVAHPAGVVEMDVGDGHPGQIVGPEPQLVQRGRSAGTELWLPVSTRTGAGPGEQVAGRHPFPATEQGVDLDDPGGDLRRHGWPVTGVPVTG